MTLVIQPRLAIPLWAIASFTVALTAPPTATLFLMPLTTVFAVAAIGIGAMLFLTPVAMSGYRDSASRRIASAAGTGVSKLDGASPTEGDDASRLDCMDDDGGWQMTRPAA